MKCGLLGEKLGHSYSPQIHAHLGSYAYALFEKKPEELESFLKSGSFHGLNVTIPYKKAVIPYCAELSPRASQLGAVNTLVRREDGSLIGHNTDYFGFSYLVRRQGVDPAGKKALVLGSGGASSTAVAVLKEMGAETVVISRSGENNYGNLDRHSDAALIVNTTPVGTYPHVGDSPLSLSGFLRLEAVLDVVYNPARTQLLLDAERLGIPCMNGLWMLVAQAKESAEWFTGEKRSDDCIPAIHRALERQMKNIILTGMPGCGKSTVGRLVAQRLGRQFVDGDEVVEKEAGISIPEIFAAEGENGFRTRETAVLKKLGMASSLVIATGGGCVTREENYPLLHQNGTIFWLKRELSLLATDGRPLSQSGRLSRMYSLRESMYRRFADTAMENSGTPEEAADTILRIWEENL